MILSFRRRDGPQHQRMLYFQRGGVWLQVIVDRTDENRGLHRRSPRL
jgi:hypothetical protein